MKVTFDENGYVNGWCMVGDNGGEEYDPPDDIDSFLDRFDVFKEIDGKLVLDSEKAESDRKALELATLRERRETECFSVINRGWIWYSCLTLTQWRELRTWYLALPTWERFMRMSWTMGIWSEKRKGWKQSGTE